MKCCGEGGGLAWRGRAVGAVQWAVPLAALVLVPKCPGCVAGYVLVLSGIGLSMPVAAAVRWGMIGVSVAALVYLVGRAVWRRALREP